METVLAVGFAALVIALLRRLRRVRADRRSARALSRVAHPYHCVALATRGRACEAVRMLQGRRFLAAEAPRLPLSGCGMAGCSCVYEHFKDRRHHDRRTADRQFQAADRRVGERRRAAAQARDEAGLILR